MKEIKYIKTYQNVVMAASLFLILALISAWIISGPGQEWRRLQHRYSKQVKKQYDTIPTAQQLVLNKGISQFEITGLNRTDRCVTCHIGIENPQLKNAEQPYKFHPGNYLENHPVEKYGCTVCHAGQGRALNLEDAHAINRETHWDRPLLSDPYIQSSCGQCHLSVFEDDKVFTGADVFKAGHSIFSREGCLGCHKARGVGGIIGPDLTHQGEKTRQEYNFQNITSEQTVSNWLKEHFRDPEMVSPGSQMLKIDLPEKDLMALSTFVLGLAKPDIDFEYFSLATLNEFKGNRAYLEGEKAFLLICSACHGKQGEGKSYEDYNTGVPGIFREDFLRVASDDYIHFTLLKGRSKRQMASWMTDISGLKDAEISGLTSFVKNRLSDKHVAYRPYALRNATVDSGKKLFQNHCATCHGAEAAGGIALALNRKDLLRNAENEYLFNTILRGRENATMPSWINLPENEIYDIVKYLRSFQAFDPFYAHVHFNMKDSEEGKLKYHFLCSRCHGDAGQGQTGPRIINKDFLDLAPDDFLYNTISSGREHTAMFGWSKDVYNAERLNIEDIGNIISFMREEADKMPEYIFAGSNPGDKLRGRSLFLEHCGSCHGKNGEGPKAPALNNQELLNAATNGYLTATITLGRKGTAMPEWGRETEDHIILTGKERQDIVAWIRSWERIRIGY